MRSQDRCFSFSLWNFCWGQFWVSKPIDCGLLSVQSLKQTQKKQITKNHQRKTLPATRVLPRGRPPYRRWTRRHYCSGWRPRRPVGDIVRRARPGTPRKRSRVARKTGRTCRRTVLAWCPVARPRTRARLRLRAWPTDGAPRPRATGCASPRQWRSPWAPTGVRHCGRARCRRAACCTAVRPRPTASRPRLWTKMANKW